MKSLTIEDIKKKSLAILIEFDEICRINDIKYSIAYGTLLGAIRHNGFIPWDDDIDVIVKRDDYIKLQNIFNNQTKGPYKFICVENTLGFSAPLGKIIDTSTVLIQNGHNSDRIDLGVYIDVFPYDFIPRDSVSRQSVLVKAVNRQRYWSFCGNNYDNHNLLIKTIRKILNCTSLARCIAIKTNKWAANVTNNKNTGIMAALVFGLTDREKNTMLFDDLNDLIEYKFEGFSFLGIRNSDYYLKQLYGDYMKLPPIEAQVSNHSFRAFMKETNKDD